MESSTEEKKPSSSPVNKIENSNDQNSLLLFDLEAYISRYDGTSETATARLLFIAQRAPSKDLATSAFKLLEKLLKENGNWRTYQEVFGMCPVCSDEVGEIDNNATNAVSSKENNDVNATTAQSFNDPSTLNFTYSPNFTRISIQNSTLQLKTLEQNLVTAQSCLAKESIRVALAALGTHFLRTGSTTEALRRFSRAQEFCLHKSQAAKVCLSILTCALDTRNYVKVRDHVIRARQSNLSAAAAGDHGEQSSQVTEGGVDVFYNQLQCALGLAHLADGRFTDAALVFGDVGSVENDPISSMLSLEDLALYSGLLGLATMDRNTMSKSLDVESSRERLELIPPLRDAIRHYVRAEYGSCLNLLKELKWSWSLDLYLAKHVDVLWKMLRDKCIIQYFVPYKSVSLKTMMESFGFFESLEEVEEVVADLIKKKKIVGARIHGVNKTLTSMSVDELERIEKRVMIRKIGRMGDVLLREVEGTMLRLACLENHICVTDGKGGKGGRSRRRNRSTWRDNASSEIAMWMGPESNIQEDISESSGEDDIYMADDDDLAPTMMDIDEYFKM